MLSRVLGAAAVMVMLAGPALAGQCPSLVKEIDAALAKTPKLSSEQLAEVRQLRDEGERLHEAGKHGESIDTLNEAKRMLGLD